MSDCFSVYQAVPWPVWRWVGAVTLGTDPLDGLVRRIRLKDGYVYAATTGIGKGIQVVDLRQAMTLFSTATTAGESNPAFYAMDSLLGLAGHGFAQEAIVQTIPVRESGVDTTPGGTSAGLGPTGISRFFSVTRRYWGALISTFPRLEVRRRDCARAW